MKQSVTVRLSEFSVEALTRGEGRDLEYLPVQLVRAVRLYLSASASRRPGWSVPSSLRGKEPDDVELEVVADGELLRALEEEADRQDVSVSRLVGQAAIYYAAELDAGRITQRIVEDLDEKAAE
jgi:hypothetical protein